MIAVNRKYKELSFELINKVSSKKIHNTDLPQNSNILQLAVPFRKVRVILRKRNSRINLIEIASKGAEVLTIPNKSSAGYNNVR